jgi:phospholipase/lecithinase/hemolysin
MPLKHFSKSVFASTSFHLIHPQVPTESTGNSARRGRLALLLSSALLFAISTVAGLAQDTSTPPNIDAIVVFGDSLSDTGNVAHETQEEFGFRVPGPIADYTDGRFTDGKDTLPPAEKYFGVWIEQYAASLPTKPKVKDSLDGGTNFAYGYATTEYGLGVFPFGPSNEYSVDVENVSQQISDYLATRPKITDETLFVVWGGANDVLGATSEDDVIFAAAYEALDIQTLVDAGATHFLIPNLPPLGAVPRLNGSPVTSVPATEASALYNEVLGIAITVIRDINPGKKLDISELDVFSLFNEIIASPSTYSLVNVTKSSQGEPVDPDTYLFWDDLHPTTHGHNILAKAAAVSVAARESFEGRVPAGKDLTALKAEIAAELEARTH